MGPKKFYSPLFEPFFMNIFFSLWKQHFQIYSSYMLFDFFVILMSKNQDILIFIPCITSILIVSLFFWQCYSKFVFFIHFSGSTSPCEDKVVSGLAATYKGELWFKNDISVSFDACSPDNIQNNSKLSTNFVRNKCIGT